VDTHAIEVGAAALAAAFISGLGGAYLGAWKTTSHDRIERARTRRIEAADTLVAAWATALFAINAVIEDLERLEEQGDYSTGELPRAILAPLHELVNAAVKASVRLDLLFGANSLPASNTNAVRDQTRAAITALELADTGEARRRFDDASLSQAWLVNTAAEAIASTGTKRDAARKLKAMLDEPEADPVNRHSAAR
jgi:hypothetical protein